MEALKLGKRGYYGMSLNPNFNQKLIEANLFIDEYNRKIDTFETYEQQKEFNDKINEQIKNLIGYI